MGTIVQLQAVRDRMMVFRGQRVLLSSDLAQLYEVSAKALTQAVKRNAARFPADFMFRLSAEEWRHLRSQFVTLNAGRGRHAKYPPLAFTEQGVAMLSSVLNSKRAIRVNIEIMRAFVHLRRWLISNRALAERIDALEKKYDGQFTVVLDAIDDMVNAPPKAKSLIGFRR
jgi:hypothetical protein